MKASTKRKFARFNEDAETIRRFEEAQKAGHSSSSTPATATTLSPTPGTPPLTPKQQARALLFGGKGPSVAKAAASPPASATGPAASTPAPATQPDAGWASPESIASGDVVDTVAANAKRWEDHHRTRDEKAWATTGKQHLAQSEIMLADVWAKAIAPREAGGEGVPATSCVIQLLRLDPADDKYEIEILGMECVGPIPEMALKQAIARHRKQPHLPEHFLGKIKGYKKDASHVPLGSGHVYCAPDPNAKTSGTNGHSWVGGGTTSAQWGNMFGGANMFGSGNPLAMMALMGAGGGGGNDGWMRMMLPALFAQAAHQTPPPAGMDPAVWTSIIGAISNNSAAQFAFLEKLMMRERDDSRRGEKSEFHDLFKLMMMKAINGDENKDKPDELERMMRLAMMKQLVGEMFSDGKGGSLFETLPDGRTLFKTPDGDWDHGMNLVSMAERTVSNVGSALAKKYGWSTAVENAANKSNPLTPKQIALQQAGKNGANGTGGNGNGKP